VFARLRRFIARPALQTLSSLDAYARWAASYPPHAHNALMQAEETAMRALLPPLDNQVILDLACGTGRYGLLAGEKGARLVVGVDNSAAMLRASPLQYRALATTEAIPFARESLDGVICGLALGHLPTLAASLRQISRVLKPGGWALVSDFHPFIFLSGQRRTFTAPDGKTYAVEHYAHLYADYHQAGQSVGLQIDGVIEPRLGHQGTERFADPEAGQSTPVIIAYRFRKLPLR
jgi:malonyl-CoA O-methyltransferase